MAVKYKDLEKKSDIRDIVNKFTAIINSVKFGVDTKEEDWLRVHVDYNDNWNIPKKSTIISLQKAINETEKLFSNNCDCLTNTDCCQSCQSCQSTRDSSITFSCQHCQSCQSSICQVPVCQSVVCQVQSCQSCQEFTCEGCQSCQSCQECQELIIGVDKAIVLDDTHYKMAEIFPEVYERFDKVLYRLVPTDDVRKQFTTAESMFEGCKLLKTVPRFKTETITNMNKMFYGCVSLEIYPYFNMDKVITASYMFSETKIKDIPDYFKTAPIKDLSYCFSECKELEDASKLNTEHATTLQGLFRNCRKLTNLPIFNVKNIGTTQYFHDTFTGTTISDVHLNNVLAKNLRMLTNSMKKAVHENSNLKFSIDNEVLLTTASYKMTDLFAGINEFNAITMEKIPCKVNTMALTSVDSMFKDCTSLLEGIPLSPNITDGKSMYENCTSLTTLPPYNYNLKDAYRMFANCTSLYLGYIDTSSYEKLDEMFLNCRSLTNIIVDLKNAKTFYNMFEGCTSLQEVILLNVSEELKPNLRYLNCPETTTIQLY